MAQPTRRILTREQVKAGFRRRGETVSGWARDHGYKPQKVLRVLNGFEKGHYGTAHEIAVKLGLKDGTVEHGAAGVGA